MPEKLTTIEIEEALANLNGWSLASESNAISKSYVFGNFVQAFGFMAQAALIAEKMDHHPEWSNVYKTVEVNLTTHNAGGITELDIKLAGEMDKLA